MNPPLHQRGITIVVYILGGMVVLGVLLDSLTKAISLLTPMIAGIGTAFIVLSWLLTTIILRRHPITWIAGAQKVRLRKLGIKPTAMAFGMILLLWIPSLLTPFQHENAPPSSQPNITATDRSIAAGGNIKATAQPGGTAIITTGNVNVDVNAIVDPLLKAHERELSGFREREQAYQDQIKALTEAVAALTKQEGPRIADAVAQLQQGNTAAAEMIFQDLLTRKTDEGQSANKQAAEAASHLGALAFLHNTDKALAAYRQAVRLDPEDAAAWIQLGHLLWRTGQLDSAEDAYRKALTLGEKASNRSLIASTYGSVGNVYQIQGDFPQAEAMYRETLQLCEAIGDKARMAITYGNLGIVYRTRGDFAQAEAMYHKALELDEALGRKTGMASTYHNLGTLYRTRGDFPQAEAMYRKALALFQKVGATLHVEHVQELLRALQLQKSR